MRSSPSSPTSRPLTSAFRRTARTRRITTGTREEQGNPQGGSPVPPYAGDKVESQRKHQRTFSFEFFPPKTPEGKAKLRTTWQQLAQLKPRFFSCTFGAGGSTQQGTL